MDKCTGKKINQHPLSAKVCLLDFMKFSTDGLTSKLSITKMDGTSNKTGTVSVVGADHLLWAQ